MRAFYVGVDVAVVVIDGVDVDAVDVFRCCDVVGDVDIVVCAVVRVTVVVMVYGVRVIDVAGVDDVVYDRDGGDVNVVVSCVVVVVVTVVVVVYVDDVVVVWYANDVDVFGVVVVVISCVVCIFTSVVDVGGVVALFLLLLVLLMLL